MNRRNFSKSIAIAAGFGIVSPSIRLGAVAPERKLVILHTNDIHSRIQPFEGGRNKGAGGLAKLATMIEDVRAKEKNVILLDSGDVFQGTPYFNFFGGELEFRLMSEMKYDASTLGNHDFDNGLDGLNRMLPYAKFPFLSANYDFSQTQMSGKFANHKIFKKGGLKVGVFAVGINLQGLVAKNNFEDTVYLNPIEIARSEVAILKAKGCDLIICLSHLGYKYKGKKVSDQNLAADVEGIDVILGGHTHSFLDTPQVVEKKGDRATIINQAGWAGIRLGRIDLSF